jgi:hypothetical protein
VSDPGGWGALKDEGNKKTEGTGDREQGKGNRGQGTGNREQGTGTKGLGTKGLRERGNRTAPETVCACGGEFSAKGRGRWWVGSDARSGRRLETASYMALHRTWRASGAKAQPIVCAFSARLKSCPDTEPLVHDAIAIPLRPCPKTRSSR